MGIGNSSAFYFQGLIKIKHPKIGHAKPQSHKGFLSLRLDVFADWKEPFREGVIYYLKDGRVRGVLLWNVWDKVDAARELIATRGPLTHEELRGRIHG